MIKYRHHPDVKNRLFSLLKNKEKQINWTPKTAKFQKNQKRAPTKFKNYDIQTSSINIFFDGKYSKYIGNCNAH